MTYGEAFAVQPFGNLLVTMDLTGAQIERLLEQQAITGPPGGRDVLMLRVSTGFTFAYDQDAPVGNRIDPASIKLNGAFSNQRPPTGSSPTTSWPTAATRSPCSPKGPTGSAAATTWWRSPSTSTRTRRSPRPRIGSSASSGGGGPEGPPAGVGSHRLSFNLIFRRAFLRHAAFRPPGLKRASKNQGTVA